MRKGSGTARFRIEEFCENAAVAPTTRDAGSAFVRLGVVRSCVP